MNQIIQVSGVQFYNTSSVYFIVCLPPQVKFPSITIYTLFTPFHLLSAPSGNLVITLLSMSFFFFLDCYLYLWVCCYFACQFILFTRFHYKPWDITSYLSEWLLSINQQTCVVKDMEKREPWCTVDGTEDWYSHCGKQNGVSSKN